MRALTEEKISCEAGVVGLVFPVVDFKASPVLRDFIERLPGLEGRYIFAVATCGIFPGKTLQLLDEELQKQGGRLHAGFTVAMPRYRNPPGSHCPGFSITQWPGSISCSPGAASACCR
jgi:hypothetical protein